MKTNLTPRFVWGFLLVLCIAITSCSKNGATPNSSNNNNTNTTTPAPTVESIQPTQAYPGDTVIITGKNYSTTVTDNLVKINGIDAAVISATATQLKVKVPQNGSTGLVSVKVKTSDYVAGTFTFTYLLQPTIIGFSPVQAARGATVTITGTNFSTVTTQNVVSFNGANATVQTATATQLTVIVPQLASSGPIKVTVNNRTLISQSFKVLGLPLSLTWQEITAPTNMGDIIMAAEADSAVLFATSVGLFDAYPYNLFKIKNGAVTGIYASNSNISFSHISSITNDESAFYVNADAHFYRSEDGLNWKILDQYNQQDFILGVTSKPNQITEYTYNTAYTSTDKGVTWTTQSSINPGVSRNIASSSIYLNQAANGYYYTIPMIDGIDIPVTRSTDGINWTTTKGIIGNNFASSYGYRDVLAASGNNVFSVFYDGTDFALPTQKRLYKSTDHGDSWTMVNNNSVNCVKAADGYVMYGYDSVNLSMDDGNTFTNYAIPSGYIIGGMQTCAGYLYIFCGNGSTHKIYRAIL